MLRTSFSEGETEFHCRHPRQRLVCACCQSGSVIRCGTVTRSLRKDVARHLGVSWDLVAEIQRRQLERDARKVKLSQLRRDLQREASVLDKKMLEGTRWLLAKNPENLDPDRNETERLFEALAFNRPLATAYYMKENLRMFWKQKDAEAAKQHLDISLTRAEENGITVLKTMARTLRSCRQGLLNWCLHPISTGPLEGFNNKVQTMKRQAYGYRNMDFFMLKIRTLHLKKCALTR